jgi:hypothetical protein
MRISLAAFHISVRNAFKDMVGESFYQGRFSEEPDKTPKEGAYDNLTPTLHPGRPCSIDIFHERMQSTGKYKLQFTGAFSSNPEKREGDAEAQGCAF